MKRIAIHATNISGIGAVQVVRSLLEPLVKQLETHDPTLYLSEFIYISNCRENDKIKSLKKNIPNSVLRFIEIIASPIFFQKPDSMLVLGDIPLCGIKGQVVLVHQPNIIKPSIDIFSGKSLKFKILRLLFRLNKKNVKHFIVQTGAMKKSLMASYNIPASNISVIPQPPPPWLTNKTNYNSKKPLRKITLFYPAANYPHKNHILLKKMSDLLVNQSLSLELVITVTKNEIPFFDNIPLWIKCVGRLTTEDVNEQYIKSDALFFPSLTESYGLPLVEAMALGMPIICADRPYSKWLCEDQAEYFDPLSAESAIEAIDKAKHKLFSGRKPNWTRAYSKLPENWNEVARRFKDIILS